MSTETTETKKPRYGAFHVREYQIGREIKTEWSRIGVAFPHKKGRGFNLRLSAFPIDGNITVTEITEKKQGSAEGVTDEELPVENDDLDQQSE